MRKVCIVDEREEEISSGVNLGRTFLFDSFDQNQNREVDLEEFRERIAVKFGYLDTDKNGVIDLGKECRDNDWCKPALTSGKSKLTLGQFLDSAVGFFRSVDRDGSGKLDRKQFSRLPADR